MNLISLRSLFCLFACLWAGLLSGQVDKPLVPAATLSFDTYRGLVFIQAQVDTHAAQTFLLDTGLPKTLLFRDAATVMGYDINIHKRELHPRDSIDYGHINGVTLYLDQVPLHLGKLPVSSTTHLPRFAGRPLAGIIGADLLQSYVVAIHYGTRQIQLFDPTTYEPDTNYVPVSIQLTKGVPTLPLQLTSDHHTWTMRMGLATGFIEKIAIREKTARQKEMYAPFEDYWYGFAPVSPGHLFPARWVNFDEATWLGRTWHDEPVLLSRRENSLLHQMGGMDGLLGGPWLQHFNWIIDQFSNTIYIQPIGLPWKQKSFLSWSGVRLKMNRALNAVMVYDVWPGSPAEVAGLQKGDEIVVLYDKPVASLTLDQVYSWMRGQAKLVDLYVKREDTFYHLQFRLKAMHAPTAIK